MVVVHTDFSGASELKGPGTRGPSLPNVCICLHLFAYAGLSTREITQLHIPSHPRCITSFSPLQPCRQHQKSISAKPHVKSSTSCTRSQRCWCVRPSSSCALTPLPSHLNRSRCYAMRTRELTILFNGAEYAPQPPTALVLRLPDRERG